MFHVTKEDFFMNKDLLKLFSVSILFFIALESKCSDVKKYLECIPEGKIKAVCKKFPEDLGACLFAELIKKHRQQKNDLADYLEAQKKFLEQKKQNS